MMTEDWSAVARNYIGILSPKCAAACARNNPATCERSGCGECALSPGEYQEVVNQRWFNSLQPWFAWYPVSSNGRWHWLRTIRRVRLPSPFGWEYSTRTEYGKYTATERATALGVAALVLVVLAGLAH